MTLTMLSYSISFDQYYIGVPDYHILGLEQYFVVPPGISSTGQLYTLLTVVIFKCYFAEIV